MAVVTVIIVMLGILTGFITQLSYNQKKISDAASGRRAKLYYLAQAGAVEASWRIRVNRTTALTNNGTGTSFTDDGYNPAPYSIDVDGDGTMDTTIDIDAVVTTALKNRPVRAAGCDSTPPCLVE